MFRQVRHALGTGIINNPSCKGLVVACKPQPVFYEHNEKYVPSSYLFFVFYAQLLKALGMRLMSFSLF